MKSIRSLQTQNTSIPILADDMTEFHAARLLLLVRVCGANDRLRGLTKMAKLDFFVRYPQFFEVVCRVLYKDVGHFTGTMESSMIRYHYGPWDQRYYDVLAYLRARNLVKVTKEGSTLDLILTPMGKETASILSEDDVFAELVERMRLVKKALGAKSGSQLKQLIYGVFSNEVLQLRLGEVIEP